MNIQNNQSSKSSFIKNDPLKDMDHFEKDKHLINTLTEK